MRARRRPCGAALSAICTAVAIGLAFTSVSHARVRAPVCSLDPVRLDLRSGVVRLTGRCAANGRAVSSRLTYRYRTYDELGYGCGQSATRGSGGRVVLRPRGAARAVVDATVSGAGSAAHRHLDVRLVPDRAACAPRAEVPRRSICAWSDASIAGCGVASTAPYCTWTSPPHLDGRVVRMGRFGCESRSCGVTAPPGRQPKAHLWLGSLVRFEYWACADTTSAVPRLVAVRLVGTSGHACRARTPFDPVNPVSSFALPAGRDGRPAWGGDLYVAWKLDQYGPGSRPLQGSETETGILHLPGNGDGCRQLTGR